MTGGNMQIRSKGEVVIVALKISATGRELLTWTLAKFTRPGDHVIALHVSPSASEADALRQTSDTASQQLDDIFEGFCSIKQINLKVKVIHSLSLKNVLIDEAKRCYATRLILGISSGQLLTGSPFPLAKYCSNHVPVRCSVLVIQCGQVVFEKSGALSNPGNKSGLLHIIQHSFKIHCSKVLGQNGKEGRADVSEKPSKTNKSRIFHKSDLVDSNSDSYSCNSSFPSSGTNSPVSVLHASKHILPQMRSFVRKLRDMKSSLNLIATSDNVESVQCQKNSKILDATRSEINLERYFSLHESFRNYVSHHKGDHQWGSADSIFDVEGSANSGWKTSNRGNLSSLNLEQRPKELRAGNETLRAALRRPWDATDVTGDPGWPLLQQTMSTSEEVVNTCTAAHRMSVVEWALKLPDRPKEKLENHSEFTNWKDHSSCPALNQNAGEHSNSLGKWNQKKARKGSRVTSLNRCDTNLQLPFANTRSPALICHDQSCVAFQFSELQMATNNFSCGNFVGKGGCSKVYRGILSNGRVVAVKYLNSATIDAERDFLTEVEIISTLHHSHIVQLIGYCDFHEHYLQVFNFATEGNLEQKLHYGLKGKAALPWDVRYKVAVGVAKALNYLHDGCARPIIHRDVKSSNILLSVDLEPQLTDFGLAKWAPTTSTHITCSDVVGSFGYIAPEYFMYGKVNDKTDVYSFGVVLLELITGKHPVYSAKPEGQENLVLWARPLLEDESRLFLLVDPKLEEAYNAWELKNMTTAAALCLRQSPHSRPRMSRILKLLLGEYEDLEHFMRQDPHCREMDDGYDVPNYRDSNIQTHLTMALVGLDDDAASQGSIGYSGNLAYSNKFLESYLRGRCSHSGSFD